MSYYVDLCNEFLWQAAIKAFRTCNLKHVECLVQYRAVGQWIRFACETRKREKEIKKCKECFHENRCEGSEKLFLVYLLVLYWTHKAQFAFPSHCYPSTKASHNPMIIEKIFYLANNLKAANTKRLREDNKICSHFSMRFGGFLDHTAKLKQWKWNFFLPFFFDFPSFYVITFTSLLSFI